VRQHVQVWTVSGSISGALGPVVVGLLVEASWRWIFLLNLPIGALAIFGALRLIPRITREEDARIPDLIGGGLLILGIGSLALGLVQGTDWGWGSSRVVSSFVVAAVAVGLVRRHSPCAVGGSRHRQTVGSLGIATRARDR
jgi:MFS family permease